MSTSSHSGEQQACYESPHLPLCENCRLSRLLLGLPSLATAPLAWDPASPRIKTNPCTGQLSSRQFSQQPVDGSNCPCFQTRELRGVWLLGSRPLRLPWTPAGLRTSLSSLTPGAWQQALEDAPLALGRMAHLLHPLQHGLQPLNVHFTVAVQKREDGGRRHICPANS